MATHNTTLRRFDSIKPKGHKIHLADNHPALVKGQSLFQARVEHHSERPRLLIDGHNSRKIGRRVHGPDFERRLWDELAAKQEAHPDGFLVRLHILGDFYSVEYAQLWAEALEAYPALHVFGYTARSPESDIGQVVCELLGYKKDRFHVRFSGWDGPSDGSVVIDSVAQTEHVVCPAQLGKTECCATCALCWHSDRTIAFLRH